MVSFFCNQMFLSLSLNANFLASLLFFNSLVRVFHIENGVSLPCKFETMWFLTPSRMTLLDFAVSFFHWDNYCASNILGFWMSVSVYSNTRLSSSTASIISFQAMKFQLPSRAYSQFVERYFPAQKKTCFTESANPNL